MAALGQFRVVGPCGVRYVPARYHDKRRKTE